MEFLGRLLKIDNLDAIDRVGVSLAAPWAQVHAAWLVPGLLVLCALAVIFYVRFQARGRRPLRLMLAVMRSVLLCLLFLFLADPVPYSKNASQSR